MARFYHKLPCLGFALGACLTLWLASTSRGAGDSPPGQTRLDKVRQAYHDTDQYQARTAITITRKQGRWLNVDEATMHVAFDRPSGQLKIDSPDFLLVRDGTKLRAKSPRFPGQYLDLPSPSDLAYEPLASRVPMVSKLPVVDAIFLLAEKPISVLSEGVVSSATPLAPAADDPQNRPRLQCAMRQGKMTLRFNRQTMLVELATLRVDTAKLGGKPGDYVEMRFEIEVKKHDQPIDDKQFQFDKQPLTAVGSFGRGGGGLGGSGGAGSRGGQGSGASAANQGGGGGGHRLISQKAPDFTLKDLEGKSHKLSEMNAEVLIVTFWASWAPPCQEVLPALEQIQKWAHKHKLEQANNSSGKSKDAQTGHRSVKVLTINTGQPAKQVRDFLEANDLGLPVLLDDFTVAEKYDMVTVPHTVLIADGKIRYLHSGPSDDYVALFKPRIKQLLNRDSDSSEDTKPTEARPGSDNPNQANARARDRTGPMRSFQSNAESKAEPGSSESKSESKGPSRSAPPAPASN